MTQSSTTRPQDEVRFVNVRGHRVRVSVREGSDGNPPFLLCNGLGVRLEALQPFVDALSPDRGIIRFDMPGVGESPSMKYPYRMWQAANLVLAVLDAVGVEQVDVLGVSWGGALTQQFAARGQRRVRRVVLVSTSLGTPTIPGSPKVIREMFTRRRFDDPDHARKVAAMIYGGKARENPDSLPTLGHMRNSRRGLLYQQLAMLGWSSVPFAWLIRQPTLILMGADDPIIPVVNGKLMRAVIDRSELQVFDDGHLGLITSAEDVAALVERFLDRD